MKALFSNHPNKAARILRWCILIAAAVYILFVFVVSVSTAASEENAAWFLLMSAMLLLWSAPLAVSVGVLIQFAVWQIDKHSGKEPWSEITGHFAAWFSAGIATLSIGCFIIYIILSDAMQRDFPQYSLLALENKIQQLSLWCAVIALISLLLDYILRFLLKKCPKLSAKPIRIVSNTLTVVICLAILLVPHPSGSYNDGGEDGSGSKIYEAALYEVIDWNRTHNFDGTPYPETEQQMQLYFFPQNCFNYDTKWELRH